MSTMPIDGQPRPGYTKACGSCHRSKLKCDVDIVGSPCSQCVRKGCQDPCARIQRQSRKRSHKAKQQAHVSCRSSESVVRADANAGHGRIDNDEETGPHPCVSRLCEDEAVETTAGSSVQCLSTIGIETVSGEVDELHSRLGHVAIMRNDNGNTNMTINSDNVPDFLSRPTLSLPILSLSTVDFEYLSNKGVFMLPSTNSLHAFLKCYFEICHQYCPVVDSVKFMESYDQGTGSLLIINVMLAVASSYVPMDTLTACGYADRPTAQASFLNKASLLLDFDCEQSLLCQLQGSLILSYFDFYSPTGKDARYWHVNAVRLVLRLGLHKKSTSRSLDSSTYKLYKRIWWIAWSGDMILFCTGQQNLRLLDNPACDVPPLAEEDWKEVNIPSRCLRILSPVSDAQRAIFYQQCQLGNTASRCLIALNPAQAAYSNIPRLMNCWRASVAALQASQQEDSNEIAWTTTLIALSYRFECMFYRLISIRLEGTDPERQAWAKQRLKVAFYELQTIVGRVMTNSNLAQYHPLLHNCILIIIALHAEKVTNPSEPEQDRKIAKLQLEELSLSLKSVQHLPVVQRATNALSWLASREIFGSGIAHEREDGYSNGLNNDSYGDITVPWFTWFGIPAEEDNDVEHNILGEALL